MALFASGSPFGLHTHKGKTYRPAQGNNAYVFPGIGLGAVACRARTLPDELFLEAARLMDDAQLFIPVAAPIRWSLVSGRVPGFAENPFARHTLVGLSDPRLGGTL